MKKVLSIVLIAMLLVCAVCLTACGSKLLKETTLTVKDGILQVANPVVNTVCKAFVNGEEQDVDETTYEISVPEDAGESLDVSVEVYNEKGKEIGTITGTFKCLPVVTVVAKDGYYDWTESDAALKEAYPDETIRYFVWLNKEVTDSAEARCEAPTGVSRLRVRPYLVGSKDVFGQYSAEVSFTMLATPPEPLYDGTYLTWAPVSFEEMAPTYNVKLTTYAADGSPEEHEVVTAHVNALNLEQTYPEVFEDAAKRARMSISIQAASSDETLYQSSRYSEAKVVSHLDGVEGVRFNGDSVEWTASEVADSYYVRVEGGSGSDVEEHLVEGATSYKFGIIANHQIVVRVKPNVKGAAVYTNWSSRISATYLTSKTLRFDNGLFYWDYVPEGDGFRFTVEKLNANGDIVETIEQEVAKDVLCATYPFADEGNYNVYLTTLAGVNAEGKAAYVDSVPSDVIHVTRLPSPRHFYLSEELTAVDLSNQANGAYALKITFDTIGGNDSYYQLLLDGTTVSNGTAGNSFTFVTPSTTTKKDFTLQVRSMSFNETSIINGQLTLSSLSPMTVKLCKLGTPKNLVIDDDSNLVWTDENVWDYENLMEEHEKQYTLYANGAIDDVFSTASSPLARFSDGDYKARVSARGVLYRGSAKSFTVQAGVGDGELVTEEGVVISSDFSNIYYLNKLKTPENVRIIDGGTVLTWDATYGAVGYKITVNRAGGAGTEVFQLTPKGSTDDIVKGNSIKLEGLTYKTNGSDFSLTEEGCVFYIYAVGNHGKNLENGEPITMDSGATPTEPLFKLAPPTHLIVEGSSLKWTMPEYKINVTDFEVYDRDVLIGVVTGQSFDLSSVSVGAHFFNVRSVGDNETYFTSDSAILEKGEVVDGYKWTRIVKLPTIDAAWQTYGNGYRWQPVSYTPYDRSGNPGEPRVASSYEISVALSTMYRYGEKTAENAEGYELNAEDGYYYFDPKFSDEYPYPVVTVVCKGDNEKTMDSNAYVYYQPTKRNDVPALKNTNKPLIGFFMESGKVALEVNSQNKGNGFIIDLGDGIKRYIDGNTYVFAEGEVGTKNISVAHRGDYFDDYGTYVYSSAFTTAVNVKFLGEINDNDITIGVSYGNDIDVSWERITNATYRMYYEILKFNGDLIGVGVRQNEITSENAVIRYKDAQAEEDDVLNDIYDIVATYKRDVEAYNGDILVKVYILAVGNQSDTFSSTQYTTTTYDPGISASAIPAAAPAADPE